MKKVLVLMSTYNGENYIKEQLDSIISQDDVDIYCLIRDDGSKDQTRSIICEYCLKNSKISYIFGDNIGWANSFYSLVNMAGNCYDYYAFSDQDDVWDKDKLIKAINSLDGFNTSEPLLYCSNLKVVDKFLNWTPGSYMFNKVYIDKEHALIENYSTGCTQVFNRKMRELYTSYTPQYLHAHDYWMYLVAIYMGRVVYDNCAYINYRQHGYNVKGSGKGLWGTWRSRIKSLSYQYIKEKFSQHTYEKMAQELLIGYSSKLSEKDKIMIQTLAFYRKNIMCKLNLLINTKFSRSSFAANLGLKVRILIGIL